MSTQRVRTPRLARGRKSSAAVLALAALAMAMAMNGCKAREIGVKFADTQAAHVQKSWVQAAKSCWPALEHEGMSDGSIEHQLADPLHFRAAFTSYAAYPDEDLIRMVARPLSDAPSPDNSLLENASSPLLTRAEAASGSTGSHSSTSGKPPADALCAIHPGTPVGFR